MRTSYDVSDNQDCGHYSKPHVQTRYSYKLCDDFGRVVILSAIPICKKYRKEQLVTQVADVYECVHG